MAKRQCLTAADLERELVRRGYSSGGTRKGPTPMSRRRFLHFGAGAAATVGMPPLFAGCFGDSDDDASGQRPTERRTLFFNFSHEDVERTTHHLVLSGQRHALTRTREKPQVLAEARRTNAFLRGVPDDQVTHHLETVEVMADAVQLSYVISNADTTNGTWSMSGMYMTVPTTAVLKAHAMGLAGRQPPPVLLSAKRKRYGHGPASSAQDLLDEQALLDTNDHASTLIGMHPELLSADPTSAAYLHTHHIALNPFTADVGDDISQLGPAQPQTTPGRPNDSTVGWATLVPMTDENGVPMKNSTGKNKGLLHYNPEWNINVVQDAAQAMTGTVQTTKDDAQLGADVTASLDPGAGAGAEMPSYRGSIWQRRDGIPNVVQTGAPTQAGDGTLKYTVTNATPLNGFRVTATVSQSGDGTVPVTLVLENWYLRWLGVFVEFYDSQNRVVPVAKLPPSLTQQGNGINTDTAVYFGVLTPEFVMYAVPVEESKSTVKFDFPTGVASSAKILASGLGFGSHTYRDTEPLGVALTSIFNLIIPTVLLGLGLAEGLDAVVKLVAIPSVNAAASEFAAFVLDGSNNSWPNFANMLAIFWRSLVRALTSPGTVNKFLKTMLPKLVDYIAGQELADAVEDALPLVGAILQALGALAAVAEMAETSCEIVLSPWTYENDLVLKHDLSLTILPDPQDGGTPAGANRYQVTALFDNGGTPQLVDQALRQSQSQISLTFRDVPLGGQVSINAAFVQVPDDPAQDHVVLGKATTGLVANDADTLASIRIANVKFPIGPATQYRHKQKTVLRPSGIGNGQVHAWDGSQPAPTATQSDIRCAAQGDLCAFYGITVRQATQQGAGYVGYAWRGNSAGVNDCVSGGQSDSGQLANLNTDSSNGGAGAQSGYTTAPCGLQQQPRLTYSLLTHGSANYYLDATNRVVRKVKLDPPAFDDPRGRKAFGAFNLGSTALLQHPTGRLISINQANHKLETLKPADDPMADGDAPLQRLAQLHAGQGSRPGLLTSPTAAAVSAEGVVLVLEAGNSATVPPVPPRIQAFDTGANAVRYFGKQPTPYFLQLGAGDMVPRTYLDMAVEFTGFIYVLSYSGGGNGGLVYRLDIYHTGQVGTQPISSTQNVNAAKLCVDFWRNVYTLNYEVLSSNSGRAEPSVSLWVPTNSCTGYNCTPG